MTSRQKAFLVARLARAKLAKEILILDMRKVSNITDFFIIATSSSTKRAQTITDNIEKGLAEINSPPKGIEGYQEARWILVDAQDVVAHIFQKEARQFYNLEGLWSDASRISICRRRRTKTRKHLKKASKRK